MGVGRGVSQAQWLVPRMLKPLNPALYSLKAQRLAPKTLHSEALPPQKTLSLKEIFQKWDVHNTGVITRKRLQGLLSQVGLGLQNEGFVFVLGAQGL